MEIKLWNGPAHDMFVVTFMKPIRQFLGSAMSRSTWRLLELAVLGAFFALPLQAQSTWTPSPLADGEINHDYSALITVSSCPVLTPCSWSMVPGTSLPPGLTIANHNVSNGISVRFAVAALISGTPKTAGTFNFTVQVAVGDFLPVIIQHDYSITIVNNGPAFAITTTSLPGATANAGYSQLLYRTGGTAPFSWTIDSGSLPQGVLLNPDTGILSGPPSVAGTFNFMVRVTDSATPVAGTTTLPLSIVVAPALVVTTSALPGVIKGAPYSQTLTSIGGTPPITWSLALAGSLPSGLALASDTGVISGNPATAGTASFTVLARDSVGATASKTLSIVVAPILTVTTTSVFGGFKGVPYSQSLTFIGGTTPVTWSLAAGTLPPGLSLNSGTGVISGTPTTFSTNGFTVQVSDSVGATATKVLSIAITSGASTIASRHDFNGDGTADILLRDPAGTVSMLQLNGNTVSNDSFIANIWSGWSIAGVGDFDGDGKADILWHDVDGNVAIWLMNGTSVIGYQVVGNASGWSIAGVGDFNGDAKADILWRDTSGNVALWQMDGFNIVASKILANVWMGWAIAGVRDFNADGKADILWRDTSGNVALWQMDGFNVSSAAIGSMPVSSTIAGIGDFDGDGKADILWRADSGDVSVWMMNGNTVLSNSFIANIWPGWVIVEVADFNADGKSDILWRDPAGNAAIWVMAGPTVSSYYSIGNFSARMAQ